MNLGSEWTRRCWGASGVALLVPGSLVVLALAGGFGRLASIGQAFSGPAAPSALGVSTSSSRPPRSPGAAPGISVAAAARPAPAGPAALQSAGSSTGAGATVRSRGSDGSFGEVQSGSGGQGAPGGRTTTPPLRVPPPVTVPQPPRTLVDGVINVGTSVTTQLPGAIGSLTTQTLQSLGSTLDRILPLPPAAQIRSLTGSLLSGLHAR